MRSLTGGVLGLAGGGVVLLDESGESGESGETLHFRPE
jgi:hypothetical protein